MITEPSPGHYSPIVGKQESKVDVQSYVLMSIVYVIGCSELNGETYCDDISMQMPYLSSSIILCGYMS
jgi:hypothetical protein